MCHSLAALRSWFHGHDRVVLGYSGGVDSAVLAVVGSEELGVRFLAVIGRSASYPEAQWRVARDLARDRHIPVVELDTYEGDDPRYRRNDEDRCYYCKQELWTRLREVAAARGFEIIIDGTHADDVGEHRPGFRAGRERGVRSPFVELGWSKDDIRRAARGLDLVVSTAPSAPCLASRVRYGLEVTPGRLGQVEKAEDLLRSLGIRGDLRVRHHDRLARIEVVPAMFAIVDRAWPRIEQAFLGLGFERVERDPAGYRRGSLLAS